MVRVIMCCAKTTHTSWALSAFLQRDTKDLQDCEFSRPRGHNREESKANDKACGCSDIECTENEESVPSTH